VRNLLDGGGGVLFNGGGGSCNGVQSIASAGDGLTTVRSRDRVNLADLERLAG